MKKNLISLLTVLSLASSLLPAVPAAAAQELPPAQLPDEPAPIVMEKKVEALLPSDGPMLRVESLGGTAMVAAASRDAAPDNSVLIESSQDGQTVAQMYCTLDRQNHTASLVYVPKATGMVVVPKTFTSNEIEYTVTSVGYQAFAGLTGLTQVWLPDTVSAIGAEAFIDCDHLKAVGTYDDQGNSDPYALPKNITDISVRTFRGCTRLSSVTIPAKVERIDAWAFAYCYSLGQNYTDAAGVTYGVYFEQGSRLRYIAQGAFYYCMVLENITLPEGLREISLDAFYHCGGATSDGKLLGLKKLVIPSTVTEIGENAFSYCLALQEVTIPAGIKTLPQKAFYSCSAMETLRFTGDGLVSMDTSVFYWCTKLKTIQTGNRKGLPATLTVIPRWAFYRCDSLAEVDLSGCTALRKIEPYAFNESGVVTLTLPRNLKSIGLLAFGSCRKLKTINWNRPENDEDLLEVGEMAFAQTGVVNVTLPQLYENSGSSMFYDCDDLQTVTMLEPALFVPYGAFRDCDSLRQVTFSPNLATVGAMAFYSCPKLTTANFKDAVNLRLIGEVAFCRTAFTTVTLPLSVLFIGENAFGINRSLTAFAIDGGSEDGTAGGYFADDGVLYQYDTTNGLTLVKYPAGKPDTRFTVASNVSHIAPHGFSHSENLEEVIFQPASLTIGNYAFSHCINLTTADVPANAEQGVEIFEGSYHMTQVTLPPNIEKLTSSSITVNSKITSVTLPATVKEVEDGPIGAFSSLPLLEEIQVDPANTCFKSVDGVLFSQDGTILYAYPRNKAGSEYVVPDGVTTIWSSAFSEATNLKHLVFPASVTTVRPSACYGMTGLERLDILREMPTTSSNPNGTVAYNGFLSHTGSQVQVYVQGNPTDKADWINDFDRYCVGDNSAKSQNIHVDFYRPVTAAGDRFIENGVIYTLVSPTAKTVTVGDNTHYALAQVTIPAQVTHEGVTYTVTAVESGAFVGLANLTDATVMLSAGSIAGDAFESGVAILTRSDLTTLTVSNSTLAYGDVLMVNAPANVSENATITLTAKGKSLTATVKGGVASFPVNKAMADSFGFGTVSVSANGGGATGEFTLTLSPKALTINDLPWFNSSTKEFLIEKPYDGTSTLDYTDKAALKDFTLAGDDLALHVTGTVPASVSNALLGNGNGNSGTRISAELTGSAAKYYQIGSDVLKGIRVQVVKGQLYIKEVDGILQQPTYHRVWAAEDGVQLKDCNLGGGSFIAYLPTVENNVITGYTQVDVKGYIKYTDHNPYPDLSSFDEIGVQQNQVYHWTFVPEGNGALQEKLNSYTFSGTVMPWDTNLTKGKDSNVGKTGENPALPAYVPQPQEESVPVPERPVGNIAIAASSPTQSATPNKPTTQPSGSTTTQPSGSTTTRPGNSTVTQPSGSTTTTPSAPVQQPAVADKTPTPEAPQKPIVKPITTVFSDMTAQSPHYEAVQYVFDKGIMNGVSATSFAPEVVSSRAMIVTLLYRLDGEPETGAAGFSDVPAKKYYAGAVAWATENGVVTGNVDGTFRPDDGVTWEQLVAILYRYAGTKEYDLTLRADLGDSKVSKYAKEPMSWALAEGLLSADQLENAKTQVTRAEIAETLMRFCENVATESETESEAAVG